MVSSGKQLLHENSLLLFRVGPFRFCVPATDVEAIIGMPACRSLPRAPASVQGVFSHRGQIATVINLRRKFGLCDFGKNADGQLILSRISIGLTGFRVDEVMDITAAMKKDIVELSALKQSTRFDQVLVLEDHILQSTTFEHLFQAEDAPCCSETFPLPANEEEDRTFTAEEKKAIYQDGIRGKATPSPAGSNGRKNGTPDDKITGRTSDKAAEITSSAENGVYPAAPFTPRLPLASSSKIAPRKSKGFHQDGKRSKTSQEPIRSNPSRSHFYNPPHESTSSGRNYGRIGSRKIPPSFTIWLPLLAAVIVVMYLLWPQPEKKYQLQSGPEVAESPTAPAPVPSSLATGKEPKDIPPFSSTVTGLSLGKTAAADIENPSASSAEADEHIREGSVPPEDKAMDAPMEFKAPDGTSNRFLTIETEDFTLKIEPGTSKTDTNAPTTLKETRLRALPSPAASKAEMEYVHIVVKGDTLWDIAAEYLGDPMHYPQLAEASRIRDPDWIYPGDRIKIIIKSTSDKIP